MNEKYIVEARHKNGSLNVKRYDQTDPRGFINGITENGLFDYFYQYNPNKNSATREDLHSFLTIKVYISVK